LLGADGQDSAQVKIEKKDCGLAAQVGLAGWAIFGWPAQVGSVHIFSLFILFIFFFSSLIHAHIHIK
jgi:hypothetical protein